MQKDISKMKDTHRVMNFWRRRVQTVDGKWLEAGNRSISGEGVKLLMSNKNNYETRNQYGSKAKRMSRNGRGLTELWTCSDAGSKQEMEAMPGNRAKSNIWKTAKAIDVVQKYNETRKQYESKAKRMSRNGQGLTELWTCGDQVKTGKDAMPGSRAELNIGETAKAMDVVQKIKKLEINTDRKQKDWVEMDRDSPSCELAATQGWSRKRRQCLATGQSQIAGQRLKLLMSNKKMMKLEINMDRMQKDWVEKDRYSPTYELLATKDAG